MSSPSRRRFLHAVGAVGCSLGFAGCETTGPTDDRCGSEPPPETSRSIEAAPDGADLPSLPDDGWPQPAHDPANTGFDSGATGPVTDARFYWSRRVVDGSAVVPVVRDGLVFVAGESARLVAIDARTGATAWRVDDVQPSGPVAVADGSLFVGTDRGVLALDVATREHRWTFSPPDLPMERTEEQGASGRMRTPVVTEDAVYAATEFTDSPRVHALDWETGDERWTVPGDRVAAATAEAVFVYTIDTGDLVAADPADGSIRWSASIPGARRVAVRDGRLFAGSGIGEFAAYDATTGERQWLFEGERELFEFAAVTPEAAYATTTPTESADGGNCYALDPATGDLVWCAYLGTETVGSPAVARETVFVPRSAGVLQARDAADGTLLWQFYEQSADFRHAAVVGDALFVGTGYGGCYAFAGT